MSSTFRTSLLAVNGYFLLGFGLMMVALATGAHFFARGPLTPIFHGALPLATFSFVEAFGLAAILGAIFIRVSRSNYPPFWNIVAAVTHLFLGSANIIFWPFFVEIINLQAVGVVATIIHSAFFALEASSARQ